MSSNFCVWCLPFHSLPFFPFERNFPLTVSPVFAGKTWKTSPAEEENQNRHPITAFERTWVQLTQTTGTGVRGGFNFNSRDEQENPAKNHKGASSCLACMSCGLANGSENQSSLTSSPRLSPSTLKKKKKTVPFGSPRVRVCIYIYINLFIYIYIIYIYTQRYGIDRSSEWSHLHRNSHRHILTSHHLTVKAAWYCFYVCLPETHMPVPLVFLWFILVLLLTLFTFRLILHRMNFCWLKIFCASAFF